MAQLKNIKEVQRQLLVARDSLMYIDALNKLGTLMFYTKGADTCLVYAKKAKEISERLYYQKGVAAAYRNLGLVHLSKNNIYLSLKCFNQSLSIYKNIADTANQSLSLMSIGVSLASQKQFKESFAYLRKAFVLGNHCTHDSVMSLIIVNLVNDNSLSSDSVSKLLTKAKEIAHRYNDSRMLVLIDEANAEQLMKIGKQDEGLHLLESAFRRADSLGCLRQMIEIGIVLGDLFINKQKIQEGEGYYKRALQEAQAYGYNALTIECARKLYEYYKSGGRINESLEYGAILINSYSNYDRVLQQSNSDYLSYTLKEAELEEVRINYHQSKYLTALLLLLLAMLAAFLIYLVYTNKAKKRLLAIITQNNNEVTYLNGELNKKNDFNNNLVSLLAHDFRQPLAALKSTVALLKLPGALTSDDLKYILSGIEDSANNSLLVYENILLWIKKQMAGFKYTPVALPLKSLIQESCIVLGHELSRLDVIIENLIDEEVIIYADKEMLQFVNRNLIHNALKFSPPGTYITIDVEITEMELVVAFKDKGKGMTPETVSALFNLSAKFKHESEREKGSGLALIVSHDFIKHMNGRIWAESEPGLGSVFYYALPISTHQECVIA